METIGLQRRSEAHNKAMKNDESDGCSRRVHSTNLIIFNSEYHPFNCNNAVQVGPLLKNQAVTKQIVAAFSFTLNTNLNTSPRQLISGQRISVFKLWLRKRKIDEYISEREMLNYALVADSYLVSMPCRI